MTISIAVTLPSWSAVAADTRVRFHHDSQQTVHDGPHPLRLSIERPVTELVIPYSYRKIRRVADGWVTCAGSLAAATAAMDVLKAESAQHFTSARSALNRASQHIRVSGRILGLAESEHDETILLGAPFGSSTSVWTISLGNVQGRTHRSVGSFAINWPPDVGPAIQDETQAELRRMLAEAAELDSPGGMIRALTRVVEVASGNSIHASELVQVGQSIRSASSEIRHLYWEGPVTGLLNMTDQDLSSHARSAA